MTKYTRDELIRALDLTVFQKGTTQYSHQISSLKKTLPKYGLELVEVEKKYFELYTADSKIDYEDLFTREELGKFANRVISPNKSFEQHKHLVSYIGELKKYGFRNYTRYSINDKGKTWWYKKIQNDFKDFVSIPGHEEYIINKEGMVYSLKTNKFLGSTTSEGYVKINLQDNITGEWIPCGIHRLMMETFCPIENSAEMFVDHIDGNRSNNRLENLRWVEPHINARYCASNNREIYDIIREEIIKNGYDYTLQKIKKVFQGDDYLFNG